MWNALPHSLRAGALACTDATTGTFSALLPSHLLATSFGGLSSDWTSLPAPSVVRASVKRADSH